MKSLFPQLLNALMFVAATGRLPAADATVENARAALARSVDYMRSISAGGGYLWRYSLDLKERAGEVKATASQVWIQPPGTPDMGQAFLTAYTATREAKYLDAAREAAHALAVGQLESGGWDYLIDFDPQQAVRWYRRTDAGRLPEKEIERRRNTSTYDDNNTQSALRFLMAYVEAAKDSSSAKDGEIRTALEYGLKKLVAAQYPNGAWPQRYNGRARNAADFPILKASLPKIYPRQYSKESYAGHYTLNDNTQRDVMLTMIEAWKRYGRPEHVRAVKRGGDFLLLAQLPEPQPVWAQQYNARMEPAWARAFEPVAVCGGESSGAIRMLVDLYLEFGDEKYLEPVPRALAWYERSKIGPDQWARYYELHTNKPIYGDRDGKIYYSLDDISEERRNGYGWQGSYGVPETIRHYERVRKSGREALLAKKPEKPLTTAQREQRMRALAPQVEKVIAGLDGQGRWITRGGLKKRDYDFGDRVETAVFIKNVEVLSRFLELAR